MSDYCATSKTNMFRVTDEEKWKKLFVKLEGGRIEDFTKEVDREIFHGFGCYGSVDYLT